MAHTPTRNTLIPTLAAAALLALAGCGTLDIQTASPADKAEIQGRSTYSWTVPPIKLKPHQVLDRRTDLLRESRRLINQTMAAKGYTEAPLGQGDMRVMMHVAINARLTDDGINSRYSEVLASELEAGGFRVAEGLEGTGRGRVYERGSIVIDFLDADSPRLLWRGAAQARVDTGRNAMEIGFPKLEGAISKILARFPSRPTQ